MIIGEESQGCGYWGYEPASQLAKFKAVEAQGRGSISAARIKLAEDVSKLKEHGYKAFAFGMSKPGAEALAQQIETASGVEMHIFNHSFV